MRIAVLGWLAGWTVLVVQGYAAEYERSVIHGISTNTSTVVRYSSSQSSGTVPGGEDFDWDELGLEKKSLDQRIADAESKLNKLYFIRDVCPHLEKPLTLALKNVEIREAVNKVSKLIGADLPCKFPDGEFRIQDSRVTNLPADRLLESLANACGLKLTWTRDLLVFRDASE